MSVRGDIGRSIGGTARERAGRELRNRILTGVFLPGDRLDIDAISIEFATSRTPVREALLELSYEGLVRVEARSGVTIVGLSRHDRLDNFEILATLSGQAAAWAAQRCTPEQLATLRDLAEATTSATSDEWPVRDWSFHAAVNSCAGSPRLLAQLRLAVRAIPTKTFDLLTDVESHPEHNEIVEALHSRNTTRARMLTERHIRDAGEFLDHLVERRINASTREGEKRGA